MQQIGGKLVTKPPNFRLYVKGKPFVARQARRIESRHLIGADFCRSRFTLTTDRSSYTPARPTLTSGKFQKRSDTNCWCLIKISGRPSRGGVHTSRDETERTAKPDTSAYPLAVLSVPFAVQATGRLELELGVR